MTQAIRTIRIATQGPAGPACLYPQVSWNAGNVPYARSTVLAHNGAIWLALRSTSVEPSAGAPDDWALWLDFSSSFATLGGDGKIPAAQLPASILGALNYQGTWNASTNTPTIPAAASGNKGLYYKVSVAGTTTISGINDWGVGDWIVSNGATWDKIDNTDQVLSVAGRTGAVTLAASDISGLATSATTDATNASNITSGTLSNSRLSSKVPYVLASSAVGVSHTGDTSLMTLATITVPANTLGNNGMLRISMVFNIVGTAGTKTRILSFGGTTFLANALGATILANMAQLQIQNRGAENSQLGFPTGVAGFGASSTAQNVTTASIDTTANQDIVIAVQLANSADSIELASYLVEVVRP